MIHIRVPSIPISLDRAYETVLRVQHKKGAVGKQKRFGKKIPVRRLTDEGKNYKAEFRAHVLQNYPSALTFFSQNEMYGLLILLHFHSQEKLYNTTWGSPGGARDRFKRLDISNRVKLLEDALSEAVGIDDKHNFFVGAMKTWTKDAGYSDIWAFRLTDSDAITTVYRDLVLRAQHD